ncbi:hypothetical protein H920_13739 [Fukomys damarensis]|uniref:Uncharacterized protein n=1 Tax=Fukomys damarensis TaxID=885580 RepID=A0A091D1S2_FUKDA|nr:hypothetical protein H920_13739 [Fukomys damarensis]
MELHSSATEASPTLATAAPSRGEADNTQRNAAFLVPRPTGAHLLTRLRSSTATDLSLDGQQVRSLEKSKSEQPNPKAECSHTRVLVAAAVAMTCLAGTEPPQCRRRGELLSLARPGLPRPSHLVPNRIYSAVPGTSRICKNNTQASNQLWSEGAWKLTRCITEEEHSWEFLHQQTLSTPKVHTSSLPHSRGGPRAQPQTPAPPDRPGAQVRSEGHLCTETHSRHDTGPSEPPGWGGAGEMRDIQPWAHTPRRFISEHTGSIQTEGEAGKGELPTVAQSRLEHSTSPLGPVSPEDAGALCEQTAPAGLLTC